MMLSKGLTKMEPIEQVVSNAVEAALAEQMSESTPEDIVIVDSEGNELRFYRWMKTARLL